MRELNALAASLDTLRQQRERLLRLLERTDLLIRIGEEEAVMLHREAQTAEGNASKVALTTHTQFGIVEYKQVM
jgi:hypothetical protein